MSQKQARNAPAISDYVADKVIKRPFSWDMKFIFIIYEQIDAEFQ